MLNQQGSSHRLERWARIAAFAFPLDILPFALGRSPSFFCSLILVVFWLDHRSRYASASRLPALFGITLATWCVWCLVTLFWSAAPDVTILALVSLVVQAVVFLALLDVLPRMRDTLVWWYAAGASCLAVWALLSTVEENAQGRVQVAGVDQNVTGFVLAIGFAAVVYLLIFSTDFKKWPLVLAAILLVSSSVKVASRTGVGAIGLVLLAVLLISLWRLTTGGSTRFLRSAALVAAGAGGYVLMVYLGFVPERVLDFLTSPSDAGDSERSQIINAYLQLQNQWWFTGVGYGADADFLAENSLEGYRNAHSLFWKTWIETGLIGLVIWGAFLLGVLIVVIKHVRADALGAVLAVPIIAYGYTLGGDRSSAFWFVVAVCLTPVVVAAASDELRPARASESTKPRPQSRPRPRHTSPVRPRRQRSTVKGRRGR